jgi:RimJ/RimL family protein N-acetyltransferase
VTAAVQLRPAVIEDAELLLAWRNDRVTRAASRNQREVTWEEHITWLTRVLADETIALWVAEHDGAPAGQLRFDGLGGAEVEITISLDRERRGQGLGPAVILAGVDWLAERQPDVTVVAEIRPENAASRAAFARAGFTPAGERGEMLRFHRSALPPASD